MTKYFDITSTRFNPSSKNIYIAKYEGYWLLCQNKKIIEVFGTRDKLNVYYDQIRKSHKSFPVNLKEKESPNNPIKLGSYFVSNNLLRKLITNELGIKKINISWSVTLISYNIKFTFNSEQALNDWLESLKNFANSSQYAYKKKTTKVRSGKRTPSSFKKKKPSISKGNYSKGPSLDMDWWREQD